MTAPLFQRGNSVSRLSLPQRQHVSDPLSRMNLKTFLSLLVPVLLLLLMMIPAACASESEQQNPTCSVSRLPDNTFLYQLSSVNWTSKCSRRWEDGDGTNLAMNLKYDHKRVASLTIGSITLKNYTTTLRFMWQCAQIREQVNCSFDCRAPAHLGGLQPPTDNTTQICFSEGRCVEQLIVFSVVGVISIIILAAIVVVIVKKVYTKCKKESVEESLGHQAEVEEIELEEGLIDHRV